MQLSVGLVWLGALLVLGGVLFTAAKALFQGRLSEARERGEISSSRTLEPTRSNGGFSLQGNRIGLGLIAIGFLLLLSGAIF